MYREKGGRHNLLYLHAEYQIDKVVLSFDGDVIEGNIPHKKLKLVLAWVKIRKENLQANWNLLCDGRETFKIDPLR